MNNKLKYKLCRRAEKLYVIKKRTKKGTYLVIMWFVSLKSAMKEYAELQKKIPQPCMYCKKECKPKKIEVYKGKSFGFCGRCEKHSSKSMLAIKALYEGTLLA